MNESNDEQRARRLYCSACGNPISLENFIFVDGFYYCEDCYNEMTEEMKDDN